MARVRKNNIIVRDVWYWIGYVLMWLCWTISVIILKGKFSEWSTKMLIQFVFLEFLFPLGPYIFLRYRYMLDMHKDTRKLIWGESTPKSRKTIIIIAYSSLLFWLGGNVLVLFQVT